MALCSNKISQRNQSEHTHKGHVLRGTNHNTLTRVMYSEEPIRTHSQGSCTQRNQSEHTHKGHVLRGTNQNTLTRVMYSKEPIRTHSQGSCTQRNQSEHTHKGHVLTVITARALLSAKSRPSLTLPRHTAKNKAPSQTPSLSPVEHSKLCLTTQQ